MKYKLIGVDFDGTLLTDNKEVSNKTIKSLKNARKQGIIIVAVTGRTIESVKNVININLFDYLILNNGSTIYSTKNKEKIFDNYIDKEYAKDITNILEDSSNKIDYCTFENYYTYKADVPENIKFIIKVNSIEEVKDNISKMNIFINKDYILNDKINEISKYQEELKIIIMQDSDSEKQWIVITPKGISKKKALENLGEYLNIDMDDMIFFGDGLNDIEAISSVGMGIAMGNALEIVKENSKDITKSNNDNGIAYYINRNILKSE